MNSTEHVTPPDPVKPAAAVVRRRRFFSVIWVVPLMAALVAGYLIYLRAERAGPKITIRFANGEGLRAGQSVVKYRGVTIGEVRSITLSPDFDRVLVEVQVSKSAAEVAREGSIFWIVRAELGVQSVTGLGTLMSGPYIEVLPGKGKHAKVFEGAPSSPVKNDEPGLTIVLLSARRGSLTPGAPVYYRGVEVGAVQEQRLSSDARLVESQVFIRQPYAPLVRSESKFWNVSGVNVDFGLFRGAQVNVESLKSLVSGGVAFATPDKPGQPLHEGTVFRLYDEPEKEWLEWSPSIPLGKDIRPARQAPEPERELLRNRGLSAE